MMSGCSESARSMASWPVVGFSGDSQAGRRGQQGLNAVPEDRVVVSYQYAQLVHRGLLRCQR